MIITKQQAIDGIDAGNMVYDGRTEWDNLREAHWIIKDNAAQAVHHVAIFDDESMIGCMDCGLIVTPEPDTRGIGCHCPNCKARL